MPSRGAGALLAATAIGVGCSVALSACGEAQQTKTITVTTTAPSARSATTASEAKRRSGSGGAAANARRLTPCDANVSVKAATTTCPFAENVFYEYWHGLTRGGDTNIKAFSPALGTFLAVDCKDGDRVECRTDAGALVRFPLKAINAYTSTNAATYARGHTVSKAPRSPTEAPTPPSTPKKDCDPSYAGACLDPSASDYDCEGGSGDGPEYTSRVTVTGNDHFGLDRDGDGIACE